MRKILIYFFFLGIVVSLHAQNQPLFTQYLFNHFAINPAVAGSYACPDFKFGHRRQYTSVEGAPITSFFTYNQALNKGLASEHKGFHAIGAAFFSDDAGPFSFRSFYGAYAFHLPLKKEYRLSMGIFGGVRNYVFSGGSVLTPVFDPVISRTTSIFLAPEFHPGFLLYDKKMFAGITIFNAFRTQLAQGGNQIGEPASLGRTFVATYGRKIKASGYYYTFIPSMLVRFTPFAMPSADFNLMWYIKNQFALGASYRTLGTVCAIAEFTFLKWFRLGYGVDYSFANIGGLGPLSHEVVLKFSACGGAPEPDEDYLCPAYQ